MANSIEKIPIVKASLLKKLIELEDKQAILRDPLLRDLMGEIKNIPNEQKAEFGQAINKLKAELNAEIESLQAQQQASELPDIDVTAPIDINQTAPKILGPNFGSINPINTSMQELIELFQSMGYSVQQSRELDSQYFMFDSLNFPEGHPARDEYDNFLLEETDKSGNPLLAPAHTSVMQNRILKSNKKQLEDGLPIAFVTPGRVFRNEDLDARHEHTFYQIEGVYVDKNVTVGNLIATLKQVMSAYFQREVETKIQPFYFPFTEPSFEVAISCPFCDKVGCKVCGHGWIELLGCGMIHPNVLEEAGIDSNSYNGFAFGLGFMRMVMIKYDIEDVRHFHSSNLEFMRQF